MIELPLDQNFPEPILEDIASWLEQLHLKLVPIRRIDDRLTRVEDRQLVIALYQLGYRGLVTNDYNMLKNPRDLVAIMKTKISVFAIKGLGHHPIRATGALLMNLPKYVEHLMTSQPTGPPLIFQHKPSPPPAHKPWDLFTQTAKQRQEEANELYAQVKVSDEELDVPILESIN